MVLSRGRAPTFVLIAPHLVEITGLLVTHLIGWIGAPDAISALGARRYTLGAIARAKMQEAASGAAGTLGR